MCATHRNRLGRSGGRGLRPLLLLPKVLAVAVYSGGLAATVFVWFTRGGASGPPSEDLIFLVRDLITRLVVPALLVCLLLGTALTLMHRDVFTRLRWWRTKVALLVPGLPLSHWFMATRLVRLHDAAVAGQADAAARNQFSAGLVVVLLGSLLVIVLGRHKPRLGQNWARDYAGIAGRAGRAHRGAGGDAS